MKLVVFFLGILLGTGSADFWNQVNYDTPEVAHAKTDHFAAVANAKSQIASAKKKYWAKESSTSWEGPDYRKEVKYKGPVALPPGYDHYGAPLPVQDTPEVAHAKALHLATVAKAGGKIHPSRGPDKWTQIKSNEWSTPHMVTVKKYHGPLAYSPGYDKNGAPLPVVETPDVMHAKALHLNAHAKAVSAGSYNGGSKWKRSIDHQSALQIHNTAVEHAKAKIASAVQHQYAQLHSLSSGAHYAPEAKYQGPVALPPGYDHYGAPLPVQDTPEVSHTKAERLAALSHAGGKIHYATGPDPWSSHGGQNDQWDESPISHSPIPPLHSANSVYQTAGPKYHGPFAQSPGYDKYGAPLPVVETPEVKHAKALHLAAHYEAAAAKGNSAGHKWKRSIDHQSALQIHNAAVEHAKAKIASAVHQQYAQLHSLPSGTQYAPGAKYQGQVALPPGYDHYGAPLPVQDTPEVSHTKAERLAALSHAGGNTHYATGPDTWSPHGGYEDDQWDESPISHTPIPAQHSAVSVHHVEGPKYHGPFAHSPGYDKYGAPLPVVETPEVMHAKALHLAAHYEAAAAKGYAGGHKWKRSINYEDAKQMHNAAVDRATSEIASAVQYQLQTHDELNGAQYTPVVKYQGPIAEPPGYDQNGAPLQVLDTPEVAHTKAERLSALANAGGHIYPAPPLPYNPQDDSTSWSSVPAQDGLQSNYEEPTNYYKRSYTNPTSDTTAITAERSQHPNVQAKFVAKNQSPATNHRSRHW